MAMTDTITESPATTPTPPSTKANKRFKLVQPVLEQLFELYPHLFGERFVPLKVGIFQDILEAHPDVFTRTTLKAALGMHTGSTRYLQCVANGTPRFDLQGNQVQALAPQHIFHAIVTLFKRRQTRSTDDLLPQLRFQLMHAYETSGLLRADYLACIEIPDEATISAALDDAIAQVDKRRARRAALITAFEASGKPIEEFAEMFKVNVREVKAALETVRPAQPLASCEGT